MPSAQVVIDTNVIFAALRSARGASYRLVTMIGTGAFEINLSVPLVFEYEDVLMRQRRSLGRTKSDIDDLLDYLCTVAKQHEVYFLWRPYLPDPNDDMILDLAVNAGCTHIVTYNKQHFRNIEGFGIEAVTAKEFLHGIGAI